MPGGRPTLLTPEVHKRIVDAVRAGNYMETAARYAGVSKTALHNWLKKGREAKSGKHRQFVAAVEKALGEAEALDVATIGLAAKDHWQAAAWRLERKFPARWGRKDRVEVEGKVSVTELIVQSMKNALGTNGHANGNGNGNGRHRPTEDDNATAADSDDSAGAVEGRDDALH